MDYSAYLPTALGNNDIFSTSGYFESTRSPLVLFLRLDGLAQVSLDVLIHTVSYNAYFLPRVYTYLSTSVLIAFLANALQLMLLISDTYTRLSTAVNIMSIIYLFDEKQVLRVCFL